MVGAVLIVQVLELFGIVDGVLVFVLGVVAIGYIAADIIHSR